MKTHITSSATVLPSAKTVGANENSAYLSDVNYAEYIEPKLLRRMSKVIRMSVAAAKIALREAGLENPEAILVGTGLGCLTDTQRFLTDMCSAEEGVLSPTAFIQSTHNTIAGQIGLLLECNGYNSTYSDRAHSFEQALLDAQLHLLEGSDNILVGAADETVDLVENVVRSINETGNSSGVTKDYFLGEGSSFFVVSDKKKLNSIELKGLKLMPRTNPSELQAVLTDFLSSHSIAPNEIDLIILGDWPNTGDKYYAAFREVFNNSIPTAFYKKQSGHYFTSSAYALHLGCHILRTQSIPESISGTHPPEQILQNILIYNHYKANKHSFCLISK